jgi:hypothetical protein
MPRSRDKKQKKMVKKSPLNRRMRMMKHEITTDKYKIDKYKKEDCTDESDPITLEDFLEEQQIVYFKAGAKNHCFELQNFAGMLLNDRKNNKISKSPNTREPISDAVRNMIIDAVYTEDLTDVILTQRFLNAIENKDEHELNQITPILSTMFAGKVMPRELLEPALFKVNNKRITYAAIKDFYIEKNEQAYVNIGTQENPNNIPVNYINYIVYLLMKPVNNEDGYRKNSIRALFDPDYYNMKPTGTMLEYAIKLDNKEIIDYMINRGAPINQEVILVACQYNPKYDLVEELMSLAVKRKTIYFTESEFINVAILYSDNIYGYRYCLMMMCLGLDPSDEAKKQIGNYINVHPEKFTDETTKDNFTSFNNLINMRIGTYKRLKQKLSGLFGEDFKEFKKLVKKLWFK